MSGFLSRQVAAASKNVEIVPLIAIVSGATAMAIAALVRAAVKNPDVSWSKSSNPEPWNKIHQNERVKLFSTPHHDYSTAKFPASRPSMDNDKYTGI